MSQCSAIELSVTTQGPTYPPSEVMDADGNFIVIGRINRCEPNGMTSSNWGAAIVSPDSPTPPFGRNFPYNIVRELNPNALSSADKALVLHTLPLPLPCHNYPMVFSPEQCPDAEKIVRHSLPFHKAHIPDFRPEDGRRLAEPVTLEAWMKARGQVEVRVAADKRSAEFRLEFDNLIPNSLYTVMSLRSRDLDPLEPTRPGPLGIPNAFITDDRGHGAHTAVLPNPFPRLGTPRANRVINVILLWMSTQCAHGGAIGLFGLGGDIHAQLKLQTAGFLELETVP
ncbi:Secreted protein [Azospirillaceae bacterium]